MPLFIDYHQFDRVTIDDVKSAHMADLAIQDEYGVKYHQFWVNEEAGTVFCLMEGPDKETCAMVHRLAHGNVACAMTEVQPGFYKMALGNSVTTEGGLARYRSSGEVDLGYRSVLVVSIRGITYAKSSEDINRLQIPVWAKQATVDHFMKYGGREITWTGEDSLITIFEDTTEAVQCAKSLQRELLRGNKKNNPRVVFKMGLNTGQPVTEDGDFFHKVIQVSHRLCTAAGDNQVFIGHMVRKLCKEAILLDAPHIKCMAPGEEVFLADLLSTIEDEFSNQTLTVQELCKKIGISRPQLYRKVSSITGHSPGYFLRDVRLEKARALLQQKAGNVAQVAYEVGFNSPSYFTRMFKQRFGALPTAYRR